MFNEPRNFGVYGAPVFYLDDLESISGGAAVLVASVDPGYITCAQAKYLPGRP